MRTPEQIENLNAAELALLAGCVQPDSQTSPGARYLDIVAGTVAEALRDPEAQGFDSHEDLDPFELADGCSEFGSNDYQGWRQFLDLCAWQSHDEMGLEFTTPNSWADDCLRHIGETLAAALLEEES